MQPVLKEIVAMYWHTNFCNLAILIIISFWAPKENKSYGLLTGHL